MDSNKYQQEVDRTLSHGFHTEVVSPTLLHGAIGAAGESAELLDAIKKSLFYGKPLDKNHLIEEIGDTLWYLSVALTELNSSFEEAMDKNIAKLRVRYPEQFTKENAINRNKDAEKKAMDK